MATPGNSTGLRGITQTSRVRVVPGPETLIPLLLTIMLLSLVEQTFTTTPTSADPLVLPLLTRVSILLRLILRSTFPRIVPALNDPQTLRMDRSPECFPTLLIILWRVLVSFVVGDDRALPAT